MKKSIVLQPGKYIIGAANNLFDEPLYSKISKVLSKLKLAVGYNKKYDIYCFKSLKNNIKFEDYIDNCPSILSETYLVLTKVDGIKEGKIKGSKRFASNENIFVDYVHDDLGVAIYFKNSDSPSPFLMLVQESIEDK